MSAHTGPASNLKSRNPGVTGNISGQGGRPMTMLLGMAAVAAGLGAFWLLQFKVQNRSHDSVNPGEMPTWQFRHAQQAPEFNARMSKPGGIKTRGHSWQESAEYKSTAPADTKASGGEASSSGMVQAHASEQSGEAPTAAPRRDRGVVSSIMTALHGTSKQGMPDAVSQPAPNRRLNDRGGMYTKNSDYKDGYRRD